MPKQMLQFLIQTTRNRRLAALERAGVQTVFKQRRPCRARIGCVRALRRPPVRLTGTEEIAKIGIGFLERRIRTIFQALRAMTYVKVPTPITTSNRLEASLANRLSRDGPRLTLKVFLALPANQFQHDASLRRRRN